MTGVQTCALPISAATGVWMFVLAQTLIGIGIACTGSSLAMTATARAASPERRSVVLGIVGAFSSVGTFMIAPGLQVLRVERGEVSEAKSA